ncbi:hypothetical protein HY086_00910 [Candidatus Gottesmanbacteria bacterium]|nr:hypothetical protein [Candidatus Gottesmanbacteria bacterium]
MKPITILLSLLSLNALVIIVERLSPTTQIILQPYGFLRVHEVVQMLAIILFSFIISFLLLKVISDNFRLLKSKRGTVIGTVFIIGLYFTATGNGAHEIASHLFNTFCDTKRIVAGFCGSSFFNDYYFGNIVYFVGLLFSNLALIILERQNPNRSMNKTDVAIVVGNGIVYAFTLFAYAAFDRVLVGLGFIAAMAIIVDYLLFTSKSKPTTLPFTLYSAIAYTISTVATLIVRFR